MSATQKSESNPFHRPAARDNNAVRERLIRELRLAKEFTIIFVVCTDAEERRLQREAVERELSDLRIQNIFVRREVPHLLDVLRANLEDPFPDAVFVSGIEQWLSGSAAPDSVPFILNLNAARNHFVTECPRPLVFWIPEFILPMLMEGAPDFMSARSGLHRFSEIPQNQGRFIRLLDFNQVGLGSLSPTAREEQIKDLNHLLESLLSVPEKERDLAMQLRLLKRLGQIYAAHGDYQQSIFYARKLVELSHNLLGEAHLTTGGAYNDLGLAYLNSERYLEAERQLRKALKIAQKCDPKNNDSISLCLNNLALACLHQNKKAEAKRLLEQSLKIQQTKSLEPRLSLAYCLSQLAGIEQTEGHYQKAEDYQKQVVSIFKRLLPDDHVDIGISLGNLATIYGVQGKYAEAEEAFSEALKIAIPVLGENHPITKAMWGAYKEFLQERKTALTS